MRRVVSHLLVLGVVFHLPSKSLGVAFEEHSSWQKEPRLETEKGVSLGMSVLEMGTGARYLHNDTFFNSNAKLQPSPAEYEIFIWELFWRYGFTENWTLWGQIPVVWSRQLNLDPGSKRTADGKLGDCETGVLYQFFRRNDPVISLGAALRWKLPTGSESPGVANRNITGTGTTDVELAHIGRWQLGRYVAVGWSLGYNLRLPGPVQYILDNQTSFTNASLDLGDEIHAELSAIGAIELVALHLTLRFAYRFASALAIPEFRAETVRRINPITGREEREETILYNGARYADWDVLSPGGQAVSAAGYLLTFTPRIVFRPLEWLDIALYAQIHLMGKNTIYLVDKDGDNPTIDNFLPMQTLGENVAGGAVLGELGAATTFRW